MVNRIPSGAPPGELLPKVFGTASGEQMTAFQEAKAEWVRRLLAPAKRPAGSARIATPMPLRNVVGITIGEKKSNGRHTGIRAIRFLVQRKYPIQQLAARHRLPKTIAGLPTDIEEVGIPRALSSTVPNPHDEIRPARPGCSIGFRDPANASDMAGTFGALVTDGTSLFILSNNHVLADLGLLAPGADIFQPGLLDDPSGNRIGSLSQFVALSPTDSNLIDCAVAAVDDPTQVSNDILAIGPPNGVGQAQEHMEVHKFGRSTNYTAGRISDLYGSVNLRMRDGQFYLFEHQITIESLSNGPFSDDGDSGALVLDRASLAAVGLLVGSAAAFSFANHLQPVLEHLGVQLA